jgi:hypothetical protein
MLSREELEREIVGLRKIYIEAIDSGDEVAENEMADAIDYLAKVINSGFTKEQYDQWIADNEHERENLPCPIEIIDDVREFAQHPKGFTKDIVDEWNQYLDFDLHDKLKTYGMVGSARLNKIFNLK